MSNQFDEIAKGVSGVVNALAPLIGSAFPEAAAAIYLGSKIVQGLLAAEPTAVSLYNRITSGEQVTAAELQQYASAYEAAYQQLSKDIADKLAALPPP